MTQFHDYYFAFISIIFGAIIGSFLNALIYRLPRDINIVSPRSFCPNCKKTIVWYENIPVISFIALGGKCSDCKAKISMRYPLIELGTALVSLLLYLKTYKDLGPASYLFLFSVASVFIVHFFIDLEHKILPNVLNLILGVLFLSHSVVFFSWEYWVIGGLTGLLFPLGVTWAYYLLRKKWGLGGGDIKLFGVLGIYLGPMGIIHNIFLSCLLGSIMSIGLIISGKMNKENPISFGPHILIVASFQIFFPEYYYLLITPYLGMS